ncbi:Sensor histidine kinase YpdA [compost metagenome]
MKVKVDLENSQLRTVNAETANQLLRQQIQPHFLFNALNVLKSLIRKYPDTAEEYLISLSDFLRASVNQNKKVLVPLVEELKICHDYMEMQKIRFGNALRYQVNINDTENGYLPVFSLQPLLENAIKHNELTTASPLQIEISDAAGWVEVKNNMQAKRSLSESTGNGLTNLSERYRILSGNPVQIIENQENFIVKIKLLHAEDLLSPTVETVEL